MKKLLLLSAIALTGCSGSASLESLLQNPLYAEYYHNDLADRLATIELQGDYPANKPVMDNAELLSLAREAREQAVVEAATARKARDRGATGGFVPVAEQVSGQVMLVDDTLFTGPTFNTPPGVDLQLYLSVAIDPRDVVWPDDSAVALGNVQQHYGAGAYSASADAPEGKQWRTVVLYDAALKRIYGFVQLSYGPEAEQD